MHKYVNYKNRSFRKIHKENIIEENEQWKMSKRWFGKIYCEEYKKMMDILGGGGALPKEPKSLDGYCVRLAIKIIHRPKITIFHWIIVHRNYAYVTATRMLLVKVRGCHADSLVSRNTSIGTAI